MATKVSAEKVLADSSGIAKVWKANPDMKLGKDDKSVTLAIYQDSIKTVTDLNTQIEEVRHQLDGLIDNRDDAALALSGYNTRALSAIRGIFGPDSTEYDQAGGTRTSERKPAVRKPKSPSS
jgi:hypothetical protein